MRSILLKNLEAAGDVVMLTAAVRDLQRCYPGQFNVGVKTLFPQLWENNPHITPLADLQAPVEEIECRCNPLKHLEGKHYLSGFIEDLNLQLGLSIKPSAFRGDLHLSEKERSSPSIFQTLVGKDVPYWIIVAGGKSDYTIKWWHVGRYQQVVDALRGKIQFVQVGGQGDYHPALDGVLDLRGCLPCLRDLIQLVYHSSGVLCPVTLMMHLAAAVLTKGPLQSRPCVVVAGGREPPNWYGYPTHQFIHTVGCLPCCARGGCWRARTVPLHDGSPLDKGDLLCINVVDDILPRCMHMITAEEVVRRIDQYFLGGVLPYLHQIPDLRDVTFPICAAGAAQKLKYFGGRATGAKLFDLNSVPQFYIDNIPSIFEAKIITSKGESQLYAATMAEEFLDTLAGYDDSFQGVGVLICVNDCQRLIDAWVSVRLLRFLGCSVPIELWFPHTAVSSDLTRSLLAPLDVKCGVISPVDGWPSSQQDGFNVLAILQTRLKRVLILDLDTSLVVNADRLLCLEQIQDCGAVFWPSHGRLSPKSRLWETCGIAYRDQARIDRRLMVIDKQACWRELLLCSWYSSSYSSFEKFMCADFEPFQMAFLKCGKSYAFPTVPQEHDGQFDYHHDFQGTVIAQSRRNERVAAVGTPYSQQMGLYRLEREAFAAEFRERLAAVGRFSGENARYR